MNSLLPHNPMGTHAFHCNDIIPWVGFPLSRNFYVGTHVNFTRVNKIETIYGRSHVNMKVKPRSNFTITSGLSHIVSILFTRVPT